MRRSSESDVRLSRGWWIGDHWEQQVRLRLIDDRSEEELLDKIDGMPPLERDTALLSSSVLGADGNPVNPDRIRQLSMGDRQTLLLLLRQLTLGNTMDCLLRCPFCMERMDLQLKVDDLIVLPDADPQAHYEEVLRVGEQRLQVTFSLPTAADVEEAASAARSSPASAAAAMAQRCIKEVTTDGERAELRVRIEPEDWPDDLLPAISARLEKLDPQAEIKLELTCPACRKRFDERIDPGGYLFQELAARQRVKYQEVHQLAIAYHWSEADILRMGPRKRQLYLELLAAD